MESSRISSWNDAIENTVKFVGESAQAYKIMHLLSAKQYSLLHNCLMYTSLILSPIAGTLAAIESVLGNPSIYLGIIIAVISFMVTVIAGIIKFGGFYEKSESHKIATSKYTSLESNVRRQLQLYREDRMSAHEYFEWLSQSFDDLFHGAPFIDDHIYQKYYNLSIEKGLVFPNRYDNFITIEKGLQKKFISQIENTNDIIVTKEESNPNSPRLDVLLEMGEVPIRPISEEINPDENSPDSDRIQFTESESGENLQKNTLYNNIDLIPKEIYPRRRNVNTPISDLNRYGDAQMNYELKRFMNF